jgi:transitional endoplasmic reticulum ATPase
VELFKLYLENRPIEKDIDYNRLAVLSDNYVSSDIKFMVNEAARNALRKRERINQIYLEKVIRDTKPSILEGQIKIYEAF